MNIGRLPQQQIVQLKPQVKPEEVNDEIKQEETANTQEVDEKTVQEAPENAATAIGQESYCAQMGIKFVSKSKSANVSGNTTNNKVDTTESLTANEKAENKNDSLETPKSPEDKAKYSAAGLIIKGGKYLWKLVRKGWSKLTSPFMQEQAKTVVTQKAIGEGIDAASGANEKTK